MIVEQIKNLKNVNVYAPIEMNYLEDIFIIEKDGKFVEIEVYNSDTAHLALLISNEKLRGISLFNKPSNEITDDIVNRAFDLKSYQWFKDKIKPQTIETIRGILDTDYIKL